MWKTETQNNEDIKVKVLDQIQKWMKIISNYSILSKGKKISFQIDFINGIEDQKIM